MPSRGQQALQRLRACGYDVHVLLEDGQVIRLEAVRAADDRRFTVRCPDVKLLHLSAAELAKLAGVTLHPPPAAHPGSSPQPEPG